MINIFIHLFLAQPSFQAEGNSINIDIVIDDDYDNNDTSIDIETLYTFQILECGGELKPEVVQSTTFSSLYPARSVLFLAEVDGAEDNGKANFWLAEEQKTTGQGITLKVDDCTRLVVGCQIKNKGKEVISGVWNNWWSTKDFRISGSTNVDGPWETLVEDQLVDTTFSGGKKPALLLNFTFEDPVQIQFLKFDLVSFWGSAGGGLQYFAAIPAPSKKHLSVCMIRIKIDLKTTRWVFS